MSDGTMTCEDLGITRDDACPDCGGDLGFDMDNLIILECLNGCGWQCVDDPDDD